MQPSCSDHKKHEVCMDHGSPLRNKDHLRYWRWEAADGCSGTMCEVCVFAQELPDDTVSLALLDDRGLPLDKRAWKPGDVLADLLQLHV